MIAAMNESPIPLPITGTRSRSALTWTECVFTGRIVLTDPDGYVLVTRICEVHLASSIQRGRLACSSSAILALAWNSFSLGRNQIIPLRILVPPY
jgi:hypothetical protein